MSLESFRIKDVNFMTQQSCDTFTKCLKIVRLLVKYDSTKLCGHHESIKECAVVRKLDSTKLCCVRNS